jgi:phenylalanyl-tRNA synthetase beta chain
MKASYSWLKEFVDFKLSPDELGHVLTMAGLEVEAIEEAEGNTVLDIGVTPNRPDCLSIRGIAREISAILHIPFKDVSAKIEKEEGNSPVIEVQDPELCQRYTSRIMRGVKPGTSPSWLSKRLEACGIRSMSNIVDITNYILLETGQPLHAFDLARLSGKKIVVKRAGDTGTFTTLDDEERTLSRDMLMIWDRERPVAVAGVMGGQYTEVSESTIDILLESACFKAASVRKTSKTLNLSTESSYRFERGVDIECVTLALDRAARLISEIAGGSITRQTDVYPVPHKPRKIPVSFKRINSVIGADIDESFVQKALHSLGFQTEREGEIISVVPPSFRNDVEREVDIAEEVVRLYGYDRIPSTLPEMQMSPSPEHKTQDLIRALKDSLTKSGYYEAINYSFLNPDLLESLNLSADDPRRRLISIRNPLRKEESVLRTSLVPALLTNVATNLNRGEKMLRLFEISRVFLGSDNKLPDEVVQCAAVIHKDMDTALWQDKHDGFYDLKGAVENILNDINIRDISFEQNSSSAEPYLHPGKSCTIHVKGAKVGSVGTLHPGVAESFDIKGNINIMELYDLDSIVDLKPRKQNFVSLPKYPYVDRDIAILVSDDVTVSNVHKEILAIASDIIESVNVFDVYKGKSIPPDKKSLAFSIRYRSAKGTLTDNEVDAVHQGITRRLQDTLKAELRS